MNQTLILGVVVVAVAALALLLRGRDERVEAPPGTTPRDLGDAEVETGGEDDADPDEGDGEPEFRIPVTSEGIALMPNGRKVLLLDLSGETEAPDLLRHGVEDGTVSSKEMDRHAGHGARGPQAVASLGAGDFTGVRARRDASGGWLLEALGRDGDYSAMHFASEDAAREAAGLFERVGVVQRPIDEDGEPVPPSAEDFEEARRLHEETERDLVIGADEDEPPRNDWSSRR